MKRMMCPEINAQVIAVADRGQLAPLMAFVAQRLPDMNLVNLTTSLHRIAKVADQTRGMALLREPFYNQTFQSLLTGIAAALVQAEPTLNNSRRQTVSNVIWSLATLRCVQLQLLSVVAPIAREFMIHFKPFEFAAAVWAFSKLGALHPSALEIAVPVLHSAASVLPLVVSKLNLRLLSMVSWGFARNGQCNAALFGQLARQVEGKLAIGFEVTSESILDLAFAFDLAGVRGGRIWVALRNVACSQIGSFNLMELSDLVNIFATQGILGVPFLDACECLCRGGAATDQHQARICADIANARWRIQLAGGAVVRREEALVRCSTSFGFQETDDTRASFASCGEAAEVRFNSALAASIRYSSQAGVTVNEKADRTTGSTCVVDDGSDVYEEQRPDEVDEEGMGLSGWWTFQPPTWDECGPGVKVKSAQENVPQQDAVLAEERSVCEVLVRVRNTFLELGNDEVTVQESLIREKLPPALPAALVAMPEHDLDVVRVRYQISRTW